MIESPKLTGGDAVWSKENFPCEKSSAGLSWFWQLPRWRPWQPHNSVGTWKVNIAKSKYTPPPMPLKSYTMVREPSAGVVKVKITGERTDGTPITAGYSAKPDGSETAVTGTGTPYHTIAIKQVDANTFTADAKKKDGKYRVTFRSVNFERRQDDDHHGQRHGHQRCADGPDAGLRQAVNR